MGMWGARPKDRQAAELSADRLSQLMTFVERATVPAPEVVAHDLPPRLAPTPGPAVVVEETPGFTLSIVDPTPEQVAAPVTAPVTAPAPVPTVTFPEPILVAPSAVAGKRRRLLPQSA